MALMNNDLARGLYADEINCLASRMLGDVSPYFANAAAAREETKSRVPVRWLGVFARDQIPQDLEQQQRPFALIFNTDPADKPGQHWLALYGPKDGPLELFDSFALHPSLYSFDAYSLVYSTTPLQSTSTATCGHYCLYFLYLSSHNRPFNLIVNMAKAALSPDHYVFSYVQHLQFVYRVLNPCHCSGQCSQIKCLFC